MAKHWIGVDLDGTLAHYEGWVGIDHIGPPIPAMLERVKDHLAKGDTIKIFTARVAHDDFRDVVIEHIHAWCLRHGLPPLEVTNIKDFGMILLYDDRCRQIELNTGRIVGE